MLVPDAHARNLGPVDVDRDRDDRLLLGLAARDAGLPAADIGLIDLDAARGDDQYELRIAGR